jgi:hypothetical protein
MDEEELLFIHCLTIIGAVTPHKGHKMLGIDEGDGDYPSVRRLRKNER